MTATTIRMPQLGESVTEGTVAQWLKKPGDAVEKYEPFVEVATDKVTAEVPAPVSGIIRELIVGEGETVPTGAPIAVIDVAGADEAGDGAVAPEPEPERAPVAAAAAPRIATNGATADGPRLSPAVRRLARERGVDPTHIAGTGAHGRVTAEDVLAAARGGGAAVAAPPPPTPIRPAAPAPAPAPARHAPPPAPGELVALTQARRLIAQRMVESKHTAPHAWTMVEVDVTALWKWREREKAAFEARTGQRLTLLPFFMRAVVEALHAFPLMNSSFTENGIRLHREINLGIAVAADGNLVVPVVRNAGERSIEGLALAAGTLIEKARTGKLGPDDLTGGTFTVNNTGANGSILSAPIIVPGQAGIITMEAVVKRPVVRDDDAIAIRSMMNVCLSLDHRIVDGALASAFLTDVRTRLQGMGPTGQL
jgi:2-oxoisovalerate dehydrogenase E2 component (dihydrolipoyl transacylase)